MKMFSGEGPEDLLKLLRGLAGQDEDSRTVLEELPMKPNWEKLFTEFKELCDKEEEIKAKRDTVKKLFWSTIEHETGLYRNNMKCDLDRGIIIVYATEDDKKKMNASFFRKKDTKKEEKNDK